MMRPPRACRMCGNTARMSWMLAVRFVARMASTCVGEFLGGAEDAVSGVADRDVDPPEVGDSALHASRRAAVSRTSSTSARKRSGCFSVEVLDGRGLRTVPMTWSPRSRSCSVRWRPKPLLMPVISQMRCAMVIVLLLPGAYLVDRVESVEGRRRWSSSNGSGQEIDTLFPDSPRFFELLAMLVDEEPLDSFGPLERSLMQAIGIEKGKPFAPDGDQGPLVRGGAARRRDGASQHLSTRRRPASTYYPDRKWQGIPERHDLHVRAATARRRSTPETTSTTWRPATPRR